VIRTGFFETDRDGLGRRPRWRKALFAGAGRELAPRGGSLAMRTLAGNPARSLRGIFWQFVLDFGKK
jgi:hypothetical protein